MPDPVVHLLRMQMRRVAVDRANKLWAEGLHSVLPSIRDLFAKAGVDLVNHPTSVEFRDGSVPYYCDEPWAPKPMVRLAMNVELPTFLRISGLREINTGSELGCALVAAITGGAWELVEELCRVHWDDLHLGWGGDDKPAP